MLLGSETSQPNFDMSDFPSLGNRVPPQSSGSLSGSMSAARNYGKAYTHSEKFLWKVAFFEIFFLSMHSSFQRR